MGTWPLRWVEVAVGGSGVGAPGVWTSFLRSLGSNPVRVPRAGRTEGLCRPRCSARSRRLWGTVVGSGRPGVPTPGQWRGSCWHVPRNVTTEL